MSSPSPPRHRRHPFTTLTLTAAVALIAVLLPGSWPPAALYLAVVLTVAVSGQARAAAGALVLALPLWVFLVLLHGVLGTELPVLVGPITLSQAGLELALAQGARLGAIITATLALAGSFEPARFLDAVAARRWPISGALLLVATLEALPRFRARAGGIISAQRSRGLRLSGNPLRRLRAVPPLVLPLLLGALAEVDERTLVLETRGVRGCSQRTPLAPPPDQAGDRMLRWASGAAVLAGLIWRVW